jgi:hypothetical protein
LWQIEPDVSDRVAAQFLALANSRQPGHHYLDPDSNATEFGVMASVDEYDARIFVG